jgi:hypothetical protein
MGLGSQCEGRVAEASSEARADRRSGRPPTNRQAWTDQNGYVLTAFASLVSGDDDMALGGVLAGSKGGMRMGRRRSGQGQARGRAEIALPGRRQHRPQSAETESCAAARSCRRLEREQVPGSWLSPFKVRPSPSQSDASPPSPSPPGTGSRRPEGRLAGRRCVPGRLATGGGRESGLPLNSSSHFGASQTNSHCAWIRASMAFSGTESAVVV